MAEYQFDEGQGQSPLNFGEKPTPKMFKFIIDHSGGLVKTEGQAALVLLGLAILFFAVSLFLWSGSTGSTVPLTEPALT